MIGHASLDEYGDISGGKAGDQTGKEVCMREWYAKGWTQVCRPKEKKVADKLASAMEAACKNEYIGYDQDQRTTLYKQAKAVNFDLSKIKTPCECDCSSLVAVCCIAAGLDVSPDIYTGNEVAQLKKTGAFTILTAKKYLDSQDYLLRGDILVKQYSHTAIVLTDGSKANPEPKDSYNEDYIGLYRVKTTLFLRKGAGKQYNDICAMPTGAKCRADGYYQTVDGTVWLHVRYNDYIGYCSSKYLIYLRKE